MLWDEQQFRRGRDPVTATVIRKYRAVFTDDYPANRPWHPLTLDADRGLDATGV